MMLAFFKDQALTIPVNMSRPLWALVPLSGGRKHMSLWLGDTYCTQVTADTAIGSTSLALADTSVLPDAGQLLAGGVLISYASKSLSSVDGIPPSGNGSISLTIAAGAAAYPKLTYRSNGNLLVWPVSGGLLLALKNPTRAQYGVPGTVVITPFVSGSSIDANGPVALAQVDLEVRMEAGGPVEDSTWELNTGTLSIDELPGLEVLAVAPGVAVRQDSSLSQRVRFLPESRRLETGLPGFEWGSYRWRDRTAVNAGVLVETRFDVDAAAIGKEKFVSGIGSDDDLQPVAIEPGDALSPHSIRLRVKHGTYFIGPERQYAHADGKVVLCARVGTDEQTVGLPSSPRPQVPVTVAAFKADACGTLRDWIRYRYCALGFDNDTDWQFTLDRASKTVTLNRGFEVGTLFVGIVRSNRNPVFALPIYPVAAVTHVRLGGINSLPSEDAVFSFDQEQGTITLGLTAVDSPEGREVYADCLPAVEISYEPAGSGDTLLLGEVDLNPAYSGLQSGFVYLEHRRHRPTRIDLYCDKPRIATPQAYSMVSNLLSFGPVYYENDFALLQAVVYGQDPGSILSNVRLQVVPGADWRGLINYLDPLSETVETLSGGDGKASFLYSPPDAYGQYLATSSVSGAEVTLPVPLPVQQLRNAQEGWLLRLYTVANNDGFFGKVGANPDWGEVSWQTTGTPGQADYRTNGLRSLWKTGPAPELPQDAFDADGKSYTDPAFNGSVSRLVYGSALPAGTSTGSYFLAYVGRVTVRVVDVDTGIESNSILLSLDTPPAVVDEWGAAGYLRPDSGRISVNRLGGALILPINVNTSRY